MRMQAEAYKITKNNKENGNISLKAVHLYDHLVHISDMVSKGNLVGF